MSIALDPVDLSAATVGTTGELSWSNQFQTGSPLGVRAGRPTLRLYNESGCGLQLQLGTRSDRLPAGAWVDMALNGENKLDYSVEYVLAGQPVSLLLGVVYEPGEPIPQIPTLGNSPIGISGGVATSGAGGTDHILNSGNAPATPTYTTTPSDQSGASISDTNDGAGFRRILSAGVLRTVLNVIRGNATTGKASVQIGDSGDPSITTFYGQIGAGSTVPAATVSGTVGSATNATNATTAQNLADMPTDIEGAPAVVISRPTPGHDFILQTSDGTTSRNFTFGKNGDFTMQYGQFTFAGGATISGISGVSGSGSATVNHGLGATPRATAPNTFNGTNSTTFGSGSYTASTFFLYQFNSQPWVAIAYV